MSVNNLINSARNRDLTAFKAAFNEVMSRKIEAAIESRVDSVFSTGAK